MELRDVDYQRLAELRHRIRRFLAFSEREARAVGLEPQQHQLLLAVRSAAGGEAAGVGELAARLLVRHHSAVELVDRLERRGLVVRSREAGDRRRVRVRLTARGAGLLARLSRSHLAELRSSGPELTRSLAALLSPPEAERSHATSWKRPAPRRARPAHPKRRPGGAGRAR